MPRFRRRPDDVAAQGFDALSDRELIKCYRAVDREIDGDGDPAARAAELDGLAAEAVRRRPDVSAFWYDRGMYAKWRADWPASLEYNRQALDLIPPGARDEEPAAWNLGIAATALRDWGTARSAWAAYGIDLPPPVDEAEPIDGDFGPAPVRLNAGPRFVGHEPLVVDGRTWNTEVVWGMRLCPARIRIVSVPTPETGHRFGDVVLHDGDTVGTRRIGDRELGVFNEILLWERSPSPTLTATVEAPGHEAVGRLTDLFGDAGWAAEDWTESLRFLCRACSEGSPGNEHDHHHEAQGWDPRRSLGISAEPDEARDLLTTWANAGEGRAFADLEVVLR
jgi:hypothetical protein